MKFTEGGFRDGAIAWRKSFSGRWRSTAARGAAFRRQTRAGLVIKDVIADAFLQQI